jgi:hypothetical protein
MTRGTFAHAVMSRLDVDVTVHNRRAFMAWAQSEGGSAKNNMLNTTKYMPGSTTYNQASVKNYVTTEDGINATILTFKEKGEGYEAILSALRSNASAATTLKAIGESHWGTAGTLAMTIRAELARIPAYLSFLEHKVVAS